MTKIALWGLLSLGFFIQACADGNCRRNAQIREEQAVAFRGPAALEDRNPGAAHVRVFKYDGSQQCGQGQPISPEEMRKEIPASIEIYKVESKMDGLMHSMRCGANSGKANVFEVASKDLPALKKLGYKEWIW